MSVTWSWGWLSHLIHSETLMFEAGHDGKYLTLTNSKAALSLYTETDSHCPLNAVLSPKCQLFMSYENSPVSSFVTKHFPIIQLLFNGLLYLKMQSFLKFSQPTKEHCFSSLEQFKITKLGDKCFPLDSDALLPTCQNKNKPSPKNFKKHSSIMSHTVSVRPRAVMRDEVVACYPWQYHK